MNDGFLNANARLMGSNWNYNRPEDAYLIVAVALGCLILTIWLMLTHPREEIHECPRRNDGLFLD